MAQQTIGIGAAPNDDTGDDLRTAGGKINDNFTELYGSPVSFNFTADGEMRLYAPVAMTLTQQATSGTGSVAYEKSTTAAPSTFSSTTSPVSLEAGAWLKVLATGVTTLYAVAMTRTT